MSERRQLLLIAAAALLVWAWIAVPLVAGSRTLFLRDVFSVHLPLKAYGAEQLRHGQIPAFFESWALGVPFRGNPQALAFYPGNVFYLVLPFWSAFNLHYVLHWLIAFLAMHTLARALGQGEPGRMMAALTYAGGGVVVSALSFYNLLVVLAWWPLVIAGVVRGGRRALAWAALACGLALLGGEPVSLAIACLPLGWAAITTHGAKRGLARAALVLAGGVLVALPQIVATARILPFTFRAAHGIEGAQAAAYALHPLRLLELLIPLPWGWPARSGAAGWWAQRVVARPPFFLSIYAGVVGVALAARAARARRGWAALAVLALGLAWLGGEAGEALAWLSGGLFRYPEKFLVAFALAISLLAGWGLEAPERGGRRIAWWLAAAGCAVAAASIGALRLVATSAAASIGELARVQGTRWALYFALAALLLAAAGWFRRAARPAVLVALQLVALVQLWPLVPRVETAPLREPAPWRDAVGAGASVHSPAWASPRWMPVAPGPRTLIDLAACLDPAPGLLQGLSYPLAPDFEGLASPLQTLVQRNLAGLGWAERARWMQVAGVDYAVLFSEPETPALELRDRHQGPGYEARLFAVRDGAPEVFWPRALRVAESPIAALRAVQELGSVRDEAVASRPASHHPDGEVRLEARSADRVELAVRGGGGLAVVRRAFHPLWRARLSAAGESALPTQPVDLLLLGVEVPAGEHRVVLEVAPGPEIAAAIAALVAALALVCIGSGLWRSP